MNVVKKMDENRIELDLFNLIDPIYSGNVFCGNRPIDGYAKKGIGHYIVVKANRGSFTTTIAGNRPVESNKLVMIQIYVKNVNGFKNMEKITEIRDLILDLLPVRTDNYLYAYFDDIGSRDRSGFYNMNININCTIF